MEKPSQLADFALFRQQEPVLLTASEGRHPSATHEFMAFGG